MLLIATIPDDVNASSTHFEEVVLSGHTPSIQAEDTLKDTTNLFRDGTRSSLDELLATTQLQEGVDAVEVLVENTLRVLLDQLGAAELAEGGFLLRELLHGDGDNLVGGKGNHLDTDVLDVSMSLLKESGDLEVGLLGGVVRVEVEAGCVEDDKRLGVLVGGTERSNDQVRVGNQTLGLLALKVRLEFRDTVGNTVDDDGILYPSAQPQLSVLNDTEITGPEPTTLNEALLGSSGVVVVLDEQHRATELEFTRLTIKEGGAAILRGYDAHLDTAVSATKRQELGGGEILAGIGERAWDGVVDGASTIRGSGQERRTYKIKSTNQVSVIPKPAAISMVRSARPGARIALRASQKALTVEVTTASPPLLILSRELRSKEPFS